MKILSAFFFAVLVQLSNARLPAAEPVRVACVGDSITFGFGLGQEGKTYPMWLQEMLGSGYDVQNFGISARTFLNAGNAPYVKTQQMTDALAFLPNLVVIVLGTNDSKPKNFDKIDQLSTDVPAMIQKFRYLPSHPTVFIGLPPPVFKTAFTINEENMARIRERLKTIAAEENAPVIDLATPLAGEGKSFPDGVHPNRHGVELLAKIVASALQSAAAGRASVLQ